MGCGLFPMENFHWLFHVQVLFENINQEATDIFFLFYFSHKNSRDLVDGGEGKNQIGRMILYKLCTYW